MAAIRPPLYRIMQVCNAGSRSTTLAWLLAYFLSYSRAHNCTVVEFLTGRKDKGCQGGCHLIRGLLFCIMFKTCVCLLFFFFLELSCPQFCPRGPQTCWCCGAALCHISATLLRSQRGAFVCWGGKVNVAKRALNVNVCPRYLDSNMVGLEKPHDKRWIVSSPIYSIGKIDTKWISRPQLLLSVIFVNELIHRIDKLMVLRTKSHRSSFVHDSKICNIIRKVSELWSEVCVSLQNEEQLHL